MASNMFYVQPGGNMTEGLAGIGDVLKDIGDQKKEREAQEADQLYKRQAQAAVSQALESGDLDQINKTAVDYPEFGDIIYTGMGAKEKDKQSRLAGHLREVVNAPPDQVQPIWEKRIQQGELEGRDMTDSRRELDAYLADPEGMKKGYEVAYAATASPQEYKAWQESRAPKEAEPLTAIAKSRRDLENGLITQEEFNQSISNENPSHASPVSKILMNGSVIQSRSDGKTEVIGPDGNILTGSDRTATLKEAAEQELDFARNKAGERAAGTEGIKQSVKFFEQILPVRKSIDNIDLAVKALDDGAQTGVIMSKLPSIKAASIELDNIQKAMGLDVVGSTTFGALSKGELDLALTRALPTNLAPAELRKWLVDKKAAQEKLAGYMEDAATFLGIPGNTISDFITQQKELAKLQSGADGTPFAEMSDDDLLNGM